MAASVTPRAGTLYLVHVLTHATRARLDSALAKFGLSSFQFTILSVISRDDGLSSSRLSRRFHVTPQSMGETVLMLEKRGLVARTEDPAHRKTLHLSLTKEGRAVVKSANGIAAKFEKTLFDGRGADEIEQFRAMLSGALATLHERPPQ